MDNIYKLMEDRKNAAKDRIIHNKKILFNILKRNNIEYVETEFDGSGDSGTVGMAHLPESKEHVLVEPVYGHTILKCIQYSTKGQEFIYEENATIKDLIEAICYDFLEYSAPGWENNEGCFGNFLLSVDENKVFLEMNARTTVHSEHEI